MEPHMMFHRYQGDGARPTSAPPFPNDENGRYIADPDLVAAVNTSLAVQQPLLVTGEPGTGKTRLAWSVARELGMSEVLEFHTRSDSQARDILYTFDNLQRYYHAQIGDRRAEDAKNYITWQALGRAILATSQELVLIDEIDKAPRDFPNDLLDEFDRMQFSVPEIGETCQAAHRPIIIVTSNSEKQLPEPFLRRCVFHHIDFPDEERLKRIVVERMQGYDVTGHLLDASIARFLQIRDLGELEKRPATHELIVWVRCLSLAGIDPQRILSSALSELPHLGVLLKSREDTLLIREH